METTAALRVVRDLCGRAVCARLEGLAGWHRSTVRGIPSGVAAHVPVVPPGRPDRQYLRGGRENSDSSRQSFPVGLVCWSSLAAWIPYLERRLCFGAGASLHAGGMATPSAPVCRGGAHGIDRLLDAIRGVHPVLLPLHNRSLWTHRTSDRVGAHGHSLLGAGGVQQLVVEPISLWPHGVVVARHDLRQVPVDEQRRT